MRQRIVDSGAFLDKERTKPFITICTYDGDRIKAFDSIDKALIAFAQDKVLENFIEKSIPNKNYENYEIVWRQTPSLQIREIDNKYYYWMAARLLINKL